MLRRIDALLEEDQDAIVNFALYLWQEKRPRGNLAGWETRRKLSLAKTIVNKHSMVVTQVLNRKVPERSFDITNLGPHSQAQPRIFCINPQKPTTEREHWMVDRPHHALIWFRFSDSYDRVTWSIVSRAQSRNRTPTVSLHSQLFSNTFPRITLRLWCKYNGGRRCNGLFD